MKKILMFLCAVTLVFGMVGVASATTYDFSANSYHSANLKSVTVLLKKCYRCYRWLGRMVTHCI